MLYIQTSCNHSTSYEYHDKMVAAHTVLAIRNYFMIENVNFLTYLDQMWLIDINKTSLEPNSIISAICHTSS